MTTERKPRYVCKTCGGDRVQTMVRAWVREFDNYDTELVDIDWEAGDFVFYCEDCGEETRTIDRTVNPSAANNT